MHPFSLYKKLLLKYRLVNYLHSQNALKTALFCLLSKNNHCPLSVKEICVLFDSFRGGALKYPTFITMNSHQWNPPYIIGAGGIRLLNIKGLIYPPEALYDAPKEEIHTSPPAWGISTPEAAVLLRCTPASARILLHKKDVDFCKVHRYGKAPLLYWRRSQVQHIATHRHTSMKRKPQSFITAEEAHSLLNVSRSTLSRYVKNGTITPFKVLMKDAKGTRLQHLFLKSEVRRLSYFLTAIRRRGNDDDQASE